MGKCVECADSAEDMPIHLDYAGEVLSFCSFECLIAHSVSRVCRRIARQNRRLQRFVEKQTICRGTRRPDRKVARLII